MVLVQSLPIGFKNKENHRSDVVWRRVVWTVSEVMFQSRWRSQSRISAQFSVAQRGFKFGMTTNHHN